MLIRAMGAFFVRRNSGNPLYRRVLESYINMATREGVCQAVFLEGRLSRDGRLQNPKLGLVDYMLRRYQQDQDRDIVFIPVGLNYDRTLEDRSLIHALKAKADKKSKRFIFRTTATFIMRSLVQMILSRWRRYGYACVNFGKPVSVRAYCREQNIDFRQLKRADRFPEIEKLCQKLMGEIAGVIPILPVSLVATVFLDAMDTGIHILDIERRISRLINDLQANGAPIFDAPKSTRAHAIAEAVNHLMLRRMIAASGDIFRAVPEEAKILSYYANAIGHWRQET